MGAEAPFGRYRGRPTGGLALLGTFSFYGNKLITSGEGGAVTTNAPDLAARIKLLRGQSRTPLAATTSPSPATTTASAISPAHCYAPNSSAGTRCSCDADQSSPTTKLNWTIPRISSSNVPPHGPKFHRGCLVFSFNRISDAPAMRSPPSYPTPGSTLAPFLFRCTRSHRSRTAPPVRPNHSPSPNASVPRG
ncbi:MAG: DegT/DnrJ/EryC1/StrS family aminotransferase [Candidatus Synoicihabitans palmerolidicus]|nr:DegT/DnrJ/EryC1/StrS family aminotransferase [Candidatus Synoicihabitans palmerolidicus]